MFHVTMKYALAWDEHMKYCAEPWLSKLSLRAK